MPSLTVEPTAENVHDCESCGKRSRTGALERSFASFDRQDGPVSTDRLITAVRARVSGLALPHDGGT